MNRGGKQVTYKDLDDDIFEYTMRNRSRGLVLMINNYMFDGTNLPNRDASGLDRDAMFKAFRFVGFKEPHFDMRDNLTALEMLDAADQIARQDYSKQSSVVLIVLTYGTENLLYGTDGQCITYETLLGPLRRASDDNLHGIPKVLLVQADPIDGRKEAHPFVVKQVGPRPEQRRTEDEARLSHDAAGYGPARPFTTAEQSDVLIAYSLIPSTEGGSRFMQSLSEVMRHEGRRSELTHLISIAGRMMSYTPGTSMPSKSFPHPCVISQLTKMLYFA